LAQLAPKRKGTPSAGLEMIAHVPPLELYIRAEMIRAYFRTERLVPLMWDGVSSKRRTRIAHRLQIRRWVEDMEIDNLTWDRSMSVVNLVPKYDVAEDNLHHGEQWFHPETYTVFTDGSKMESCPDKVGCAFTIQQCGCDERHSKTIYDHWYHMQPYNSVFQAEVVAITEAAIYLRQQIMHHTIPAKEVVIFSDALSVLMALQKVHITQFTLVNCVMALNELQECTSLPVVLRWVKAHVGHSGNERADKLAKLGACDGDWQQFPPPKDEQERRVYQMLTDPRLQAAQGQHIQTPAPMSHFVGLVWENLDSWWTRDWQSAFREPNHPMYRQTKFWFPIPDKGKSLSLLTASRQHLGHLIQFITGHAFMARHNALIAASKGDDAVSKECTLCGEGDETPIHLVTECGRMYWAVRELFPKNWEDSDSGTFLLPRTHFWWSPVSLSRFLTRTKAADLFEDVQPGSESDEALPD